MNGDENGHRNGNGYGNGRLLLVESSPTPAAPLVAKNEMAEAQAKKAETKAARLSDDTASPDAEPAPEAAAEAEEESSNA